MRIGKDHFALPVAVRSVKQPGTEPEEISRLASASQVIQETRCLNTNYFFSKLGGIWSILVPYCIFISSVGQIYLKDTLSKFFFKLSASFFILKEDGALHILLF